MAAPTSSGQEPYLGIEVVPDERATHPQLHPAGVSYELCSQSEVTKAPPNEKHPLIQNGVSAAATDNKTVPPTVPASAKHRRKWIICLLIAALVVVGAILGGVLGTVLPKKHAKPPDG